MKRTKIILLITGSVVLVGVVVDCFTQEKSGLHGQLEKSFIAGDWMKARRMTLRHPSLLLAWNDTKCKASALREQLADAIRADDAQKIQALLRMEPVLIGARDIGRLLDMGGSTPLHFAAGMGKVAATRSLLEAGADVDLRTRDGQTPLHYGGRFKTIIELLLAHGADPNARDAHGQTVLLNAAFHEHRDVVEVLLNAGANSNIKSEDGASPLALAADPEIRNMLIQHGAKK